MRILLIEDNKDDWRLIQELLAGATGDAFDVECAERLSTGLERLGMGGIDAILLDLSLPDGSGLGTFRKAHARAPTVPIVVLTGLDDETLAMQAVHEGAQDYLVKGRWDGNSLARAVRYAIQRHRLQAELEQARQQQLEIKNQFVSDVSRELNSSLGAVSRFVTTLVEGLAGDLTPEPCEYLLEFGLGNVNRLRGMIEELLEATRTETGKVTGEPQPTSVPELVFEALSALRPSAEAKRIVVSYDLPDALPPVYATPDQARQVLVNLTENAIRYTPEEGTVSIRACVYDKDPGFVCFSVVDTGCGITPEGSKMIFERFYRESNSQEGHRKGLGLGLYISRALVFRHGGNIWVESRLGHGSVFSFTLPVFSLAKLLRPLITENDRLRESVSLITIRVLPHGGLLSKRIRDAIQRQARGIVQRSILPATDMLLPETVSTGEGEMFGVVACADLSGAEVIVRRIREQLGRSREFEGAKIDFAVSAVKAKTPSQGKKKPLEQLVEDVVTKIGELMKTATSSSSRP